MSKQFRLEPYSADHSDQWDAFVDMARNGTFIHKRRFMDYHADRFVDCSLMIFDDDQALKAVFVANADGDRVSSHGGLTFGGLLYGVDCRASVVRDIMGAVVAHYREAGFASLRYKAVPHFLHRYPAEDDLYALFVQDAQLVRRDISCLIPLDRRLPYSKSRLGSVKKGRKSGLQVAESDRCDDFHAILSGVLSRHGASPVHTAAEMTLLQERFPDQIRLFVASDADGSLMAGAWTFQFDSVLHFQYLANTDEGRAKGALDLLIAEMIENGPSGVTAVSLGASTEDEGRYLNEGLIFQKEGYGGRGVVLDHYEIRLS